MAKAPIGYLLPQESRRVLSLDLRYLCCSLTICRMRYLRTQAHWLYFADDAKCFRAIRSYTDCALLQDDIDKLVDWSNNFNVDKFSLCTVSRKRNPIICNYNMGGKVLNRVGAQRDLGVLMSDTANFSDHIHAQVNKANKMLGFIRRTINGTKFYHQL